MSFPKQRPSYILRSGFGLLAVSVAFAVMAQEAEKVQTPASNAADAKDLQSKPVDERNEKRVRVNRPEEKITPETAILRFETFNAIKTKVADDGSLVITDVRDESRASRLGLKKNDRIVEIDGQKLDSPSQAASVLTKTASQPYHIVMLSRDGEEPLEVVLGTHMELMGMLIVPDTSSRPVVHRVTEGSPAAEAGLRADDIIVGASGRETDTYKKFDDFVIPLVRKMSPGQELNLRIIRDAQENEVTVIRPEQVKLPLLDAPTEPTPQPEIVHADKSTPPRETQTESNNDFLTGFMGLPTSVPFVGGLVNNGFATTPATNAVVAVLQPDVYSSLMNNVAMNGFNNFNNGVGVPVNNGIPGVINNGTGVINNGTVPNTGARTTPNNRRAMPQQTPGQTQQNQPRQAVPGNTGRNPGAAQPGTTRALPQQQQLKQVLPKSGGNAGAGAGARGGAGAGGNAGAGAGRNGGAGVGGNANGGANANGTVNGAAALPGASEGVGNPGVDNPTATGIAAQQQARKNNNANRRNNGTPVGTNIDPNAVNNLNNGVGLNNGLANGLNNGLPSGFNPGLGGMGARGFVVVSSDAATGSFVRARMMGLMPGMSYTLAVHQLGDIAAVNQNSAGPIVAILGIIVADASGQTEVTFPVNTSMQPSMLLGRAVSLLADGNGIAGTATINNGGALAEGMLAGTAINENTVIPGVTGVTNGFNYQACGVFGYASPARFNNSGVLIVP